MDEQDKDLETHSGTARSWNRQPGETSKAWALFKLWLRDPNHSFTTAARKYREINGLKNPPKNPWIGWMQDARLKWKWEKRLDDYEAHLDQQRAALEAEQQRAQVNMWFGRDPAWREERYKMAEALVDRVKQMLAIPLVETVSETTEALPDGRTLKRVTILKPVHWRHSDIPSFLAVADKLAALALGKPTDHTKVETNNYAEMSEDELDRLMEKKILELKGLTVPDMVQ